MMMYRRDSTADFVHVMVKLSILSMPQFEILTFFLLATLQDDKERKRKAEAESVEFE